MTFTILLAGLGDACAPSSEEADQDMSDGNRIVDLLADGQAVFGLFSGEKTAEQGAAMALNRDTDFIFYSLESGPFDIPQMQAYMLGMADGSGDHDVHPIALRIPPVRDGHDLARERVRQGLDAGVGAIVFPHVENGEEAELAVSAVGSDSWPMSPRGRVVNILIIEDRIGVENAREIVGTPGVSVAIPGPGDLRRAYDGDMIAVETAIQTVLRACKEFDVACGITAGVDDIAERLGQGFRVIIATDPAAVAVGKTAAGRHE